MLGRTMARLETIRKEEFTQMWVYDGDAILSLFPLYTKQPTSIELVPRRVTENSGRPNAESFVPFQDAQFEAAFLVGGK